MFTEYDQVKERQRERLIELHAVMQLNKAEEAFNKRKFPIFRYVPSREVLQRIIMRAT